MSRFISNKSCDMCHKIELGLTEMTLGNTKHYLCYDCLAKLTLDMVEFASMNLENEFKRLGFAITCDNNGGFIISRKGE